MRVSTRRLAVTVLSALAAATVFTTPAGARAQGDEISVQKSGHISDDGHVTLFGTYTCSPSMVSTAPPSVCSRALTSTREVLLFEDRGQSERQPAAYVGPARTPVRVPDQRPEMARADRPYAAGLQVDLCVHAGREALGVQLGQEARGPGEHGRRRMPLPAYARSAIRSWPMIAAACVSWPCTSPTTMPTRSRGSAITSYQSPPTSRPLHAEW